MTSHNVTNENELTYAGAFAPISEGRGDAEVKADAVADHFKRGTDLSYNGVTVRLGNVSRTSGVVVDDRYVISISVNYLVHATPR